VSIESYIDSRPWLTIRMRRLNAQATGTTPPTSSQPPTPSGSPPKSNAALSASNSLSEAITIDPGAKARAAQTQGGAVEPDLDADGNPTVSKDKLSLSLKPGMSPWITVLGEVIPGLADPTWQTRHGSSLALLEVLRSSTVSTSVPPALLLSTARELLTLMILDRFGDFLGDTVMAPVREAAAQALGVLLKYLDLAAIKEVHGVLMEMIKQPWAVRGKPEDAKLQRSEGEKFRWEVRHAGLLGIKYEVAVRTDLLESTVKSEAKMEVDSNVASSERSSFLYDVVGAAILA
jgi:TATA-binding protein-associated factor